MHRRNSTKGLDRRKSTSSVQSKHESIDPGLARHQAHAAATLAFARAQERKSADTGHSGGGLSRSNTGKVEQADRSAPAQQTNAVDHGDRPHIRRQHSVRFVGPTGIHRSQSLGTRATQNPIQKKLSNATLRPMAITTNAPVPAAYRPPSRSSSIGKASVRGGTVDQYVSGDAFDEYYTREDDVASTPSSYRRIRRSKSMFSPLRAPNVFYTNGTPDRPESSYVGSRTAASYSQTPSTQPRNTALRAPKSMSFLRSRRDQTQSDRNDTAVQLARDRFFRDAEQQRLREQPSFLFRSKAQKQEKPFRKSVRTSSTNSYGFPIASSNQTLIAKEHGLKDVARKASKTIRNKLKRVFGRSSKDEEPITIPNQQVDARETHVRQYNGGCKATEETISDIPRPDEASLSRVASRVPIIHTASSNQQLRSNAGSIKSFESDDKSRVTSWTSVGANTVVGPSTKAQLEREQHQRLSIINEVGSHVPSSSFRRSRLANQFSAYPVVHRPSKSAGHIPAPTVDSARVYSALMKRLDENSPKAKLEASHKPSMESFAMPSQCIDHSPATIRQVAPSSRNTSGSDSNVPSGQQQQLDSFRYAGPYTQQWVVAEPSRDTQRHADDVFSPKSSSSNKENVPMGQRGLNGKHSSPAGLSRQGSSGAASYRTVPEVPSLTPQEIAKRNEPIIQPPKIIREARSTFFGGGSSYTISRTASPFRRAMTESDYNPVVLSSNVPLPSQAAPIKNPLYQASESSTSRETVHNLQMPEKAYSESIYSRTTSGQTPVAANSSISLVLDRDVPDMPFYSSSGPGDVVIIDRTTYRPTMPSGSGHRVTSSASSVEWKKWMSSEVAKLERVKENTNTSYINYALPTMPKSFHSRHVREAAQINDDEVDITRFAEVTVKQPLGVVQQQNPNIQTVPALRPILKNRSTTSLVENTELSNTNTAAIPIPPPPPPPIPPRSPLRQMQSKSSLRSVGTTNTIRTISAPNSAIKTSSMNGRNLLHKRNPSQTTLGSTKTSIKSVETPAKLIKRHGRPSTGNSASPGSGLSRAVERQFGSTSTNSRYRTPGSAGPGTAGTERFKDAEEDLYGVDGAGLLGLRASVTETEAQAMGSKQMVDLFLSSRRKRMVSESEQSGVFI
ncbi:hypothetical protein ONS95_004311 [Cadophora gregata]|uniref:uncharacterized protein n=1 Tax=Cadophora gregata TaxID=51156 RepID=UPI0026DB6B18|nr:uncharacterized protein ONS95_004311 [Cadophora gregata]KAK0105306.1 hypothetical protein ONS96_004702 [Cadophora gregata f. sp. sojae]KAK0105794.1 hypothetical protein ONS95_004311 [Cadophora gregata]